MDIVILLIVGSLMYWGYSVGQKENPPRRNHRRPNNCRCRKRRR